MAVFMTFLFVLLIIFGIGTFFSGLFTVATAKAAIVQRFGKFVRVAGAGLNFKLPWIEQVVAKVDLRVQQLDVKMETKTKDNVFVSHSRFDSIPRFAGRAFTRPTTSFPIRKNRLARTSST